jgi:hypothetical protein
MEIVMPKLLCIVALLVAGAVVACGSDEDDIGLPDPSSGRGNAPEEVMSAEEVAEEKRGDVDCPADIDTPERAAGAPVDDVVGVRPGLTIDEAKNLVLCTHELLVAEEGSRQFNMQTYGQTIRQGFTAKFAEREKTADEVRKEFSEGWMDRAGNAVQQDMLPGHAKWYVAAMGMPGEERVIAVAREEWFAEGKNPTAASVADALVKKYGPPSRSRENANGGRTLDWIYDPRGRPVSETSPLFRCMGISNPDGGTSFSPDCGLVVQAQVRTLGTNQQLAQSMEVGVIDQAGGYQAITATEQALQAGEAQRKAQEVEAAAENADAPQL